MSEFFDKYKNRLTRNGNDIGDVYKNNTIAFIEATFQASPTFRVLEVSSVEFPEITEMDARVVEVERMGSLREVLFRPNQGLNVGTYIKFDNETWLIFDKYGGIETGMKALVERCNRTLKWKDKDGVIKDVDCIASSADLGSKAKQGRNEIEWNKYDVRLPLGQLYVFVESNADTQTIELGDRFIFGSNVYTVDGIDDTTSIDNNGYGIIQMTIKITTRQEGDDFANRIAVNKYTVEETGETPVDSGENGGMLW